MKRVILEIAFLVLGLGGMLGQIACAMPLVVENARTSTTRGPGELWDALFQYMDLELLFFTCAAVFVLGLVLAVWDYIRGSWT